MPGRFDIDQVQLIQRSNVERKKALLEKQLLGVRRGKGDRPSFSTDELIRIGKLSIDV